MNKLEARMWAILTEEKLTFVRDTVLWPNRKFINTIMEASMSHSDPYPKMPWESGDSGGAHRSIATPAARVPRAVRKYDCRPDRRARGGHPRHRGVCPLMTTNRRAYGRTGWRGRMRHLWRRWVSRKGY